MNTLFCTETTMALTYRKKPKQCTIGIKGQLTRQDKKIDFFQLDLHMIQMELTKTNKYIYIMSKK